MVRPKPVRLVIVDLPVLHGHRPPAMLRIIWTAVVALVSAFRSRRDLVLENLALTMVSTMVDTVVYCS